MNIMFLTVSGAAFGVFMHTIGFGVSEKPEIFLPSMFLFFFFILCCNGEYK